MNIEEKLTRREIEVAELVSKGYDDKQIMRELCITIGTLRTHMTNLYLKSFISDGTRDGRSAKRVRLALWYLKKQEDIRRTNNARNNN